MAKLLLDYIEEDLQHEEDNDVVLNFPPGVDENSTHRHSFEEFKLKTELTKSLSAAGYERPSKVQAYCLQHAINGGDLLCQSRTGSGKTAIYVLSSLQMVDIKISRVQVLVLVHSRELTHQVFSEFRRFGENMGVVISQYYGGDPLYMDQRDLTSRKPQIVVGTPGRLWQLISSDKLSLIHTKKFVIDEVDKVISNTEIRRIAQRIFFRLPLPVQILFFSTIIKDDTKTCALKFMRQPLLFTMTDKKLTLPNVAQYYLFLDEYQKTNKLLLLLDTIEFNQVLLFVNLIRDADCWYRFLRDENFSVSRIHADLSQEQRIAEISAFKDGQSRILVTTDLLGRGIDIDSVNVVINVDMAQNDETYMRRVGRTGRFDRKGVAISFISNLDQMQILNDVENRFGARIVELPAEIDTSLYR